jgi:3-oxoacyl-[acyl-carrier-protein] synthase-3
MISAHGIKIEGVSVVVPSGVDRVDDYAAEWGDITLNKFKKMTGILSRHLSGCTQSLKRITASDLCFQAASNLMDSLSVDRDSIGAIIFVTQYPDYVGSPATACVLQHRLGLPKSIMAFDVNQGCAGYVYGLSIAASILQLNGITRVLLLCGDAGHKVNHEDRSQILLFGDAGSATLLSSNQSDDQMMFDIETIGSGFRNLIIPSGGARHPNSKNSLIDYGDGIRRTPFDAHMDGVSVFNFTISEVPRFINKYCQALNVSVDSFDYIILHQANKFIIEQIGKKLGVPKEKLLLSLDDFGNTSSASIPVTMCKHRNLFQNVDRPVKILFCGFGVGLSLGISHLFANDVKFLPISEIDEGWDDGLFF